MAAEAFNSFGGYSVGIPPTSVINENGAATFSSITVSGFSALGPVGNVFINGGENGYFLQTDGTGNLTWAPASGNGGNGNPGGANSQVQFNDAGTFGGDAGFTYDKVNNVLSITGNISSYNYSSLGNIYANGNITSNGDLTTNANVTGNFFIGNGSQLVGIISSEANYAAYAGNIVTANQPNITSLGNLSSLRVVGNISSGNANLGNAVIANYFVGNGSLLTGIATATTAAAVANGTSNVNVPLINSNITMSVGGNPNVMVITNTGVVSKNFNITGNSAFSNLSITQKFNSNQAANVNLGNISNLHIDGGNNGSFLQTDGLGHLTWAAAGNSGNGIPGGVNTQIQFNYLGLFGASSNFTYNSSTQLLTVLGNVQFNNANLGNLVTANYVNVAFDINGNIANFSGNLEAANANLGNLVNANYVNVAFDINGNIANFSGNLTAANANLGNLVTANYVNVAFDITGNIANFSGNIIAANANLGNAVQANYFIGSGANLSNIQGGNVEGEVANANYANIAGTAYSVNVANVSGIGNIATINLDGNAYTILHGDGTWAPESNNISSANYANFAGQVTESNQSNIHTLGNLTDLTVGNLTSNVVILDGNITATGNITANNFMGRLANGNSYVEIPVVNGNITLIANGNTTLTVTESNLTVTGDLLPSSNLAYNIGSPTQRWNDLYISGNTIDLNGSTISSGPNGIALTNPLGGTFTVIGTGSSNTASILNGSSNIIIDANSNVNISVNTVSNVVVISSTGLLVNGNANITANLTSANANLGNLAIANYVNVAYHLEGNTATFTGNLTSANANLGNLAIANYVNVAYEVNGNVANFSGNLTAANANLGNLLTVNYANFAFDLTGNTANFIGNANVGNLGTTNLIATGTGSFSGNVNMNSQNITSLAEPVNNQDAATKQYVDSVAQGLDPKASVTYASTTALLAYTYNNGASGVGATITATSNGALTLDGGTPSSNSRVLIKNETGANDPYNGIYIVTAPGSVSSVFVLTRTTDFDNGSPSGEIPGAFTFVEHGTTLADTGWVCTTNAPVTMGTTPIVFVQFSGAGSYTAGTGLTLNGNEFSISNTAITAGTYGDGDTVATFTVNQQGQLTAASNVVITANAANLSGTTLNSNITTSNLTSVGNLTGLTSIGNVNFSNTANVALGNVTNVHISGGTAGYLLGTDGSGTLSWISGGNISGVIGNNIILGTPTDGNLTNNVAYNGWTTGTYVTDGLDDLNQVSLNIAGNTFVGNIYIGANSTAGPSPLSVAFTGNYIGNPTNYLWDFGDGTTSTTRNPTKTYSNVLGGQFTVTFTAYNVNGTYGGNAANGAKGSTATSTNTNYITLFTPLPIPSFTTSPTSLDTGSLVTLTNTSLYATSYTINYGDGNTAGNPGNSWTTNTHTYTTAANVDTIYGINLTGTNQTAGNAPPYSVTTANTNVKVYAPQSPAFSSNVTSTINYFTTSGGVISFRNDTPGTPGNTASFGAQQLYNFRWGDGTANSNINIQTGLAGNPGAANITHTFALSSVQQNAATTVSYVTNLSLYTGYSTSPFISSTITITIEPEVRANFTGTANTQTDATGYSSNAQVGYLFTDYLGRDRSLFNFSNDTSPNVSFTGNVFNWTWGDTTSNTSVTSRANISHSYLNDYGSPTAGGKTVALQANGTPGTTSQSNTNTKTNYITILANPTAPSNLSSYTNVTIATSSQGTSPLLAAGAADNTGGNILANGTSVTRIATTTPVTTSTQVTNANTSLTGTLTAYVNNTASGNTSFSNVGNAVGTYSSLIVSADTDLHVANASVPTGFYKVFSATISNTLASLGNGYNDFQLRHSTTGNTNTIGMVKDNLNSAPTLVTTNTAMVTATSGTYRYISGIPYYSATGSPAITVANLELQNFTGQTFRSATPFTVASGTSYEGSGSVISTQTKTLAQIDNSANSMLTGSNVKANIGISTNYSMGNLNILVNGAVNGVSTIAANIFNVVGTSTTIQLPTKIQMYAGANSGFNEANITANVASNTQPAIRIVMSTAGNNPAFSGSTNYYTSNVWSGAQTIAGTPEAVVRYGVLKHYAVDLSTGYLPIGPDLSTGRSGLQYFTFAFVRASLANFDIILTTGSTGLSGLWVAAPGTTIDTGGFSSPTAGYPGPTSTINGWLTGYEQYNGAGVPGNSATGGNPAGTNGCALTGSDVIPLNTLISNVRYTMTLGSQNQANSFGNNILIRIALATGQTITDLQIGVAT